MSDAMAVERLMAHFRIHGDPDARDLLQILLHRCSGVGAGYSRALGLAPDALGGLIAARLSTAPNGLRAGECVSDQLRKLADLPGCPCGRTPSFDHSALDHSADDSPSAWQLGEERDFRELLLRHRGGECGGDSAPAIPMATIIARACLERDHLWRNLGLSERPRLSALMARHFGPLVERNTAKRRWKRFFYEVLWAEGRPASRPTVCDACAHYGECYDDGTADPRADRC